MIGNGRFEQASGPPSARAAANASGHLYLELSRWLGRDGCHALFLRALGEAQLQHPALTPVELRLDSHPYVDGVTDSAKAFGDQATSTALESMIVILVEILGRLIGNEMAMKLIERSAASLSRADSENDRRQEEA
ncbi:MAG: hypothetical protein ABIS15_04455 [Gemmatimonadaceae bacterium]